MVDMDRWDRASACPGSHRIFSPRISTKDDERSMRRLIDDPEHWRRRAEEARAQAGHMQTLERRRIILRIASGHDLLAVRAEERSQQDR